MCCQSKYVLMSMFNGSMTAYLSGLKSPFSRATATASRCRKASVGSAGSLHYFILIGLVVALAVRADNAAEMPQSYKLGTITRPTSSFTQWRELIITPTAALTMSQSTGWSIALAQTKTMLRRFVSKPFPQQALHQLSTKRYVLQVLLTNYAC
jgi:hypothetical protein